jgi:hypothetical protein
VKLSFVSYEGKDWAKGDWGYGAEEAVWT